MRRVFLLYSRFLAREGTRRCVLFAFFVIALVRSFEAGRGEGKGNEKKVGKSRETREHVALSSHSQEKKCELYNIMFDYATSTFAFSLCARPLVEGILVFHFHR